jgi:integrase
LPLKNGWAMRYYVYVLENGVWDRSREQKFLGDFKQLPTRRAAQNAMLEQLVLVNDFSVQSRTTTETFRDRATLWLAGCKTRKRKPVKPSTLQGWENNLHNHVLPIIGDVPLADVKNRTMRSLVEQLVAKGTLSPASIRLAIQPVKMTVASAVDEDGNPLYPVKWNAYYIDAPSIDPAQQNKPTFTVDEVNKVVQVTSGRLQMAVILLAATGMRVGELLGLEVKHFDGSSVKIQQAVWNCKVQTPKTPNAYRTIDLHPSVASLLRSFVGERSAGFIFQTRTGSPISTRNFRRLLHATLDRLELPRRGFHAFRRFRNTFLRQSHCADGLLKYWMAHSNKDMSDHYDRSCEDVRYRRDVAESLGVGFVVPKTLNAKPKRTKGAETDYRALTDVTGKQSPALNH